MAVVPMPPRFSRVCGTWGSAPTVSVLQIMGVIGARSLVLGPKEEKLIPIQLLRIFLLVIVVCVRSPLKISLVWAHGLRRWSHHIGRIEVSLRGSVITPIVNVPRQRRAV